jgi:DNA-binding helix-hairpin-helix protein with protein kinase domain
VRVGVAPAGTTGFVLARIWATIEAVPSPPAISIPNLATIAVTPAPLPPGIQQEGKITLLRIVIVGVALLLLSGIPGAWFLVLGGAWWAWASVGNIGGAERQAERAKRQAARDAAQAAYDQIVARVRQDMGLEAFTKKKHELVRLRDEYLHLPEREKAEIANLHTTAEARQRRQFLERHFIDAVSISGVGPAKKAALRSFGIETAADVTWNKVIAVRGFGEVLTRAVVDWRKSCERRFVFDPRLAVTEADRNAIRAQVATRKRTLEITLNAGAAELKRLRQDLINKANAINPQLQVASQKLAQARADHNAV